MLKSVLEGTLPLRDLTKLLAVSIPDLLDKISDIHPHPVYVDPSTRLIVFSLLGCVALVCLVGHCSIMITSSWHLWLQYLDIVISS